MMRSVMWNQFPIKNLWLIPCFFHLELSYLVHKQSLYMEGNALQTS